MQCGRITSHSCLPAAVPPIFTRLTSSPLLLPNATRPWRPSHRHHHTAPRRASFPARPLRRSLPPLVSVISLRARTMPAVNRTLSCRPCRRIPPLLMDIPQPPWPRSTTPLATAPSHHKDSLSPQLSRFLNSARFEPCPIFTRRRLASLRFVERILRAALLAYVFFAA